MSWNPFKKPELAPEPFPVVPPLEKIEWNIARFERAIEQNGKGGNRLAELNRNLARWQKLRELVLMEG